MGGITTFRWGGARSPALLAAAILVCFAAAATWSGGFGATPALITTLWNGFWGKSAEQEARSPAAALQRLGQCKNFACLRREREWVNTKFNFPHFFLVRGLQHKAPQALGGAAGPTTSCAVVPLRLVLQSVQPLAWPPTTASTPTSCSRASATAPG